MKKLKNNILIIILFFSFNIEAAALKNKLVNHASPYLAMHGNDPVAWQKWNKDSIKRAKKEGKLLYVSSGYFSCHWCHVMQRESYKDKTVAKILNEYFIPIKVDREINSALDSHLIDFVERTQGRAGWPLNVFITPDGYPLVGMTYLPKENFLLVLNNLKTRWSNEKSLLEKIAKSTSAELIPKTIQSTHKNSESRSDEYVKHFISQVNIRADDLAGGFGQQNKFPSYPQLALLLTIVKNNPNTNIKDFLRLTLDKMASQGLYDHLEGGFFRYTVDPNWQIPHFEKMLYDNALLATLYIDAAIIFNNKKYAKVAKETLDFMLRVFRSSQGAHIASLSAVDSKDIEGGYYLWQRDELQKLLSKNEMKVVELIWQLEGPADLDDGHHLVEIMNVKDVAQTLKMSLYKVKIYFSSAKNKMLIERRKRSVPRDDKLLAAWNGLVLTAYAKAAKQFKSARYAKAARDIKNYIHNNLWRDNELARAVKNNKFFAKGELEDYAYVAQGLYYWLEYKKNKQDQVWLENLIQQGWARFYDKQGWKLSENSLLKYGQHEAVLIDGVLPSSSATLINISLKVALKNKNSKLMKKVGRALAAGHINIVNEPFWYASQILILQAHNKIH